MNRSILYHFDIIEDLKNGARVGEVEEPLSVAKSILFHFEVDEVAEPKTLLSCDLRGLVLRYGSHSETTVKIGASEAFVRQNAESSK
jgi:hypothetical protein